MPRLRLILQLVLLVLLLSCGRRDHAEQPAPPATRDLLVSRVAVASASGPTCSYGTVSGAVPMKLKAGRCDDGDGLLWSGILCSVDTERFASSCGYVRAAVGQDGRVWRAPSRPSADVQWTNSFSRDMAVGLLLYVQRTRDVTSLHKWASFVREHEGRMCGVGDHPLDFATDTRCDSGPTIRGLARLVDPDLDWGHLPYLNAKTILLQLVASARTAPAGYPLHLIAQQLILLARAGESGSALWKDTAASLHNREQGNPLFALLAGDENKAVELALAQLPSIRPANPSQWSFERATSQEAWKESMLWEFVWLADLMDERKRGWTPVL